MKPARETGPVDLLLVHPYAFSAADAHNYDLLPYPPLGLLMIAAVAREMGYRVALHDGTFAAPEHGLDPALRRHPPRLIGIGAWNSYRASARTAIRQAAARGFPILAGGPDPSLYPDDYLNAGAHVVAVGEGEATIRELLPVVLGPPASGGTPVNLDPDALRTIPGLAFRTGSAGGTISRTLSRARIQDLGALPYPTYDLVPLERYHDLWRARFGQTSLPLMTARGCPYRCTWCARPVFGRTYVQRPVSHVIGELRHLVHDLGASHIRILDDIFPVRAAWIEEWRRSLEREGLPFRYDCLARADLLTDEVVASLRESGCVKVFCGVESGSPRVLDAMRKGTTVEQVRRARQRLQAAGIALHAYLMFGYPAETHRDLLQTLDLLEELRPEEHSISIAYPMPGTEFHESVRATMPPRRQWIDHDQMRPRFRTRYSPFYYRIARALARERARPRPGSRRGVRMRRRLLAGTLEIVHRCDQLLRPRAEAARGTP